MKLLPVFVMLLALLSGCQGQGAALFTDNGNPGQVKAVVFHDKNSNGKLESGEKGAQVEVAITQDIACLMTIKDKTTVVSTDIDGVAIFSGLNPGKYCVAPFGNYGMTTKMTQEVFVSSDAVTSVVFGIVEN